MRRLQEENDDLNVALDGEKRHKVNRSPLYQCIGEDPGVEDSTNWWIVCEDTPTRGEGGTIICHHRETEGWINSLPKHEWNPLTRSELAPAEYTGRTLQQPNSNAIDLDVKGSLTMRRNKEEDTILRIKDLESKLIQERIKVDQRQRDNDRLKEKH